MTFYDDTIQMVQDESCFKNLQHFGSLWIKMRLIFTIATDNITYLLQSNYFIISQQEKQGFSK